MAYAAVAAAAVAGAATPANAQDAGWQKKVAALIADNFSYPRSAQVRGEEGTAKVKVSMDASGRITGVQLVEPTSSDILNREAEKIMNKIGSFPPPPAGITSLVVPISWKLS
ncbi:energy transducer TonB [Pedomonas mirosovicensis]|uniref:energy transducer TonB n=1 Tax=Pedomonas mirosovicensis TaxID=2908641 RepID=UPI002169021E|nr:TonB family protein [Pedomonas mirosovicensis]MCH8685427.1 TonB family protein [Pedomonas mirosovicensis]